MALKNRIRVIGTLPVDLEAELRGYSEDSMIPVTKIIERAVKNYLSENK